MAHFSTQIRINATKEKVWEVLADFGGIYRWNPGVRHSYSTSESSHGLLATRHCDLLEGDDYLDEQILEWREGELKVLHCCWVCWGCLPSLAPMKAHSGGR